MADEHERTCTICYEGATLFLRQEMCKVAGVPDTDCCDGLGVLVVHDWTGATLERCPKGEQCPVYLHVTAKSSA